MFWLSRSRRAIAIISPAGGAGRTRIAALIALYLNFFVLVVQLFLKVPALNAFAPTQSEPPFQAVQLALLVLFVAMTVRAARNFHPEPTGKAG